MSKRLLSLGIVLIAAAASGYAGSSYSVLAAPARYRFFSGDIRLVCGPSALACTEITGVALHATCERDGDAWRTRTSVSFVPYVHLPAYAGPSAIRKLLRHEFDHIRDLHRDAADYARALAARRFDSLDQCRPAAVFEQEQFSKRMLLFERRSVALRR